MRYKHIIWDWNGTPLDDRWLCIEAIINTLTKRNMNTITDNEYVELFCFPVKDYYKKLGFRKGDFPNSEKYSMEAMSLPIYHKLSKKNQEKIIKFIRKLINAKK